MKFKFSAPLIALMFFSVQIAVADTYILDASNTPLESPIIADDGETNAIVSSGSSTTKINGTMTVIGDSTINNTNRLELHAAISADYPYTITKIGGGQLLFLNDSSAVGKIVITAGQVVAQGNANSVNAINGVDLNAGTLQIWALQNVTGHIYANGGTFQSAGGNNSFIGDITQNAEMSIDVTGSYEFTTTGTIGGPNESSVYRINKTNTGTWNIQGPVNCGYFDMAGGTVNVQAGGIVQGTQLVLRQANGTDTYTFTVDGGSATFTGDDHRLGHWANHVGVLNINSGSFRADNTMTVGWDGTGKLYQTGGTATFGTLDLIRTGSLIEFSGGTTTISNLYLGVRQNGAQAAAGSVTFKGDSDVTIGYFQAYHTGTVNIEDSAKVTVNNNAYFCQAANAGNISINQSGGTFTVNGNMALGHYANAMVTYNMTGGELNVPNYNADDGQSGFWLAVDGDGTLNQSGGTINAGRLNLNARDNRQVGTYVMTGGTLNVGNGGIMAIQNGAERYVIQLEKGTITAGSNSLTANVGDWSSDLNMTLTGTGDNRVTFKPEDGYSITLSGILSGDGGLIKDGAGTLILNPAASNNTYTGDTTIKNGTLKLSKTGGTAGLAPGAKIYVEGSNSVLAGTGDILGYKAGAIGAIYLENGATFINDTDGQHVTVNNPIYMNNGVVTGTGDGSANGSFFFDNAFHVTGGTDNAITANAFTLRELADTTFVDGDSAGLFDVAQDAKLTVTSAITAGSTASLTKAGKGELVLTNASAFNKDLIVDEGVLDLTEGKVYAGGYYANPNVYINEGGTLKVNNFGYSEGGRASLGGLTYQSNGSTNVHFNGGAIQINESFAEPIGRKIELQDNGGTFDIAQDVTVTLSQDINGTGALIKDGAGTLELNYNNTYTGGTTVKNGTLRLLAVGGTGSLAPGSDVVVDGYNSVLAGTGDIIGYKDGAIGSISLINGGTFTNDTDGSHITVNNPVYMNNGYITATGSGSANGNFFFDNAFHVTGGTDNAITASSFTLRALADTTFADGDSAGLFDVAEGAKLTVSSVITAGSSTTLTKSGAGELVLTAASPFNQDLVVSGGVLDLTEGKLYAGGYYASPNVYINEGGTLKVNNFGYSEGGRASLGGLTYQSNGSTNVHFNGGAIQINETFGEPIGRKIELQGNGGTFDIAQGVNVVLSENIHGSGALHKDGAGMLQLTYANEYTGGTTVDAGKLLVTGAGTIGTGAASVAQGAEMEFVVDENDAKQIGAISGLGTVVKSGKGTLRIDNDAYDASVKSGTIIAQDGRLDAKGVYDGMLTIDAPAIFSPGNSVGTFKTDVFNLNSGATLLLEQDASGMDMLIANTLNIADGAIMEFVFGEDPNGATYEIINDPNGLSGQYADPDFWLSLVSPSDAYLWNLFVSGNSVYLSFGSAGSGVPEPSTWVLLALGAMGLLYWRKMNS